MTMSLTGVGSHDVSSSRRAVVGDRCSVMVSSEAAIYLKPIRQIYKIHEAKEKYRGMFEIQKSGDKTSTGEIGLDIRTHERPKVGQDKVSRGISVPCRHATPIANAPRKPILSNNVKVDKKSNQGKVSQTGAMYD